ncbi:hypothetical protein PPYR_00339 [Photinus pyralis]|uniref:Uncharacterized protein n=1 Tax=Photinus pyralis TaxID=7054 RepID=A0A5N4B187_PHOPY|nr:hypothetical protein PPYR_00339 [Photinus pyralis]
MSNNKPNYKFKDLVGKRQTYRRVAKALKTLKHNSNLEIKQNVATQSHIDGEGQNEINFVETEVATITNNEVSDSNNAKEINFLETEIVTFTNDELVHSNNTNNDCSENKNSFINSIRLWAITNHVTHSALTNLLHVLHPELPRDSRTLLKNPFTFICKQLDDNGQYCHFGLENRFNIDGLPLYHSSNKQVWPILCLLKNTRSKTSPFIIGLFYGYSKPKPLTLYLEDFVKELK